MAPFMFIRIMKYLILALSFFAVSFCKSQTLDSNTRKHLYNSGTYWQKGLTHSLAGAGVVVIGTLIATGNPDDDSQKAVGTIIALAGVGIEVYSVTLMYRASKELRLAASPTGLKMALTF